MTLFALGTIDPLLVQRFDGFDLPSFVERVRLISDESPAPHEVLQSSGVPARTASLTGVLREADVVTLRGYDETKEVVVFRDGSGNETEVRVLELSTSDFVEWWTFSALLYPVGETVAPGS